MRKLVCLSLLLAGCAGLLAGCPGAVDPAAGRSVSARSTCRAVGFDELFIDAIFDVARIERDAGTTALELIDDAFRGCRGVNGGGCPENPTVFDTVSLNECIISCVECPTAVVRVVYAE